MLDQDLDQAPMLDSALTTAQDPDQAQTLASVPIMAQDPDQAPMLDLALTTAQDLDQVQTQDSVLTTDQDPCQALDLFQITIKTVRCLVHLTDQLKTTSDLLNHSKTLMTNLKVVL